MVGLIRLLGLIWIAVTELSQPCINEDDNVDDEIETDGEGGAILTSTVCPLFQDVEKVVIPLLIRLEEGEGILGVGTSRNVNALFEGLQRCADGMQRLPFFSSLPLLQLVGCQGNIIKTYSKDELISSHNIDHNQRQSEILLATQYLSLEAQLLGILAQINVLEQIVGNEITLTLSLSNIKDMAETFLRYVRCYFL